MFILLKIKRALLMLMVMAMGTMIQVPASAADVGVSVSIGQPGFYGRLDIGSFPRPVLVYPQPMVVQPVPVGVVYEPIYMVVPPGHAKHWSKHCADYGACNRPVYLVQENWYANVYVPHYQNLHKNPGHVDGDSGKHHGKKRGRGK